MKRWKSLGGSALALVGLASMLGFDPFTGEAVPSTISEAQTFVSNMVNFHAGQRPDSVTCSEVTQDRVPMYQCWATKSGHPDQLFLVLRD
ncbi:MAG: hypothetical protein H6706_24680 [Myxococcales bacterium]|nr:hypothetical protein [Myxococcales bacterium]